MTAGIKGVWSLRASWMDAFDSHLVLSFVGETRLLAISEEDVLDEASIPGFDGDSQTLLAATTLHDQLLQVSPALLRRKAKLVLFARWVSAQLLQVWWGCCYAAVNSGWNSACG